MLPFKQTDKKGRLGGSIFMSKKAKELLLEKLFER